VHRRVAIFPTLPWSRATLSAGAEGAAFDAAVGSLGGVADSLGAAVRSFGAAVGSLGAAVSLVAIFVLGADAVVLGEVE